MIERNTPLYYNFYLPRTNRNQRKLADQIHHRSRFATRNSKYISRRDCQNSPVVDQLQTSSPPFLFSMLLRLLLDHVGYANENRVCERLSRQTVRFDRGNKAKNRLASRQIVHECDVDRSTALFYTRAGHVTPAMEKRAAAHAPVNVYTCTVDPPPRTIQHVLGYPLSSRRSFFGAQMFLTHSISKGLKIDQIADSNSRLKREQSGRRSNWPRLTFSLRRGSN